MRNIPKPTLDHRDPLSTGIREKTSPRRERLVRAETKVLAAYEEYFRRWSELECLAPLRLSAALKMDLRHCYEEPTRRVRELFDSLFQQLPISARARCCYCGISEPKTLDHYLPKGQFSEFSILSINLIPICFDCNINKGSKWLRAGARIVLNAYSDQLPNEKFLFCNLREEDGDITPSFELRKPAGMTPALFTILNEHFQLLDLQERYSIQATSQVVECRNLFNARRTTISGIAFTEELQRKAQEYSLSHGENHWLTATSEALSESPEFLALLT